jgi:hypothetical protein
MVGGAKQILMSSELRGLAKRVMATDPYGVWPRRLWERSPGLQRRLLPLLGVDSAVVYREPVPDPPFEVIFRVEPSEVIFDRARTDLGYAGLVPRSEAMRLTLEWGRYARLL